jgi:catechol 2,3-dioxygenase-like lactoylglutathione lyase family enzyme
MSAIATAIGTRFHVGLPVGDRHQAVRFYRTLLGVELARDLDDYVRFELAEPPVVLVLIPGPQSAGGALNHLGLRMSDPAGLVAVQRRLEEAGIPTQRQEGVECCYARQTKFWVTDPGRNLWEIYTVEEDIDHSEFDDPPALTVRGARPPNAVWEHRLTEAVPERIPLGDGSVDEVRLEGTFNADREPADLRRC